MTIAKRTKIAVIAIGALLALLISTIVTSPIIWNAFDDDDEGDDEQTETDQNITTVRTLNATMISTGFATLNGELVDLGDSPTVEVYFVWGDEPGEYTKETTKDSMSSPGMFSFEISDLFIPDSTYYFQARADPEGIGEEISFFVY